MPDEQLAALGRLRTLVSDLNLFLSLAGSGSGIPAVNSFATIPNQSHPHRRGPTIRSQAWKTKQGQRANTQAPLKARCQPRSSRPDPATQPQHVLETKPAPNLVPPQDSVSKLAPARSQTPDPLPEHPTDCAELNPADCEEFRCDENGSDLVPLDEGRQATSDRLSVIESDNGSQDIPPHRPAVSPRSDEHEQSDQLSACSLEGSVCQRSPAVSREPSPSQSPRTSHYPLQSIRQASPDPSHAHCTRSWLHHPAHSVRRSSPARRPWPAHSRRTLSPNRSAGCSSVHHSPCQPDRSAAEPLNRSPAQCPDQPVTYSPTHSLARSPAENSFVNRSCSQSPFSDRHMGHDVDRHEVGEASESYNENDPYNDDGGGYVYDDGGGGSYVDYGGDGYDDGYEDYEDC